MLLPGTTASAYGFFPAGKVARTVLESGECFVRRIRATSKYEIPIRLQVLEADYLDTSRHTGALQDDSGGVHYIDYYGIRFNKQGERIGYWLWKQHPSEFATVSVLVSADDIIHVYDLERPGQMRGIPNLASVMLRLRDLDDYEFTERIRNKIAACFSVFITDDSADDSKDDDYEEFEKLEPGLIQRMQPGKSVQVATPPSKDGFGEYVKANLRGVAAGLGTSYESISGDYSQVNFSSGRMG